MKALNAVGASMYLAEIRSLVDSLLDRITSIEVARPKWLANTQLAAEQAAGPVTTWAPEKFNAAINAAVAEQGVVFGAFEPMLAAWARLSLLLFPLSGKHELGQWRDERGNILRTLLDVPNNSLLANRSFRNSWMHFDERLDRAYLEGWLGNRQRFVRTADVASALKVTVRVIDIEGLAFHYRNEAGGLENVSLADMKSCITAIEQDPKSVGPRIVKLFPSE